MDATDRRVFRYFAIAVAIALSWNLLTLWR